MPRQILARNLIVEMDSSPEAAPTEESPPSNSTSPPLDSSSPPESSPPTPPSSPPPATVLAPPPSPPPASPPPSSPPPTASPPPTTRESPPPTTRDSSPPPSRRDSSPGPPSPEFQSPPPNDSGSNPPPPRDDSSPSPIFSPPPPSVVDRQTPPSSGSSRPPSPPIAESGNRTGSSSGNDSSSSSDSIRLVAAVSVVGVLIIALLIVCVLCTRKKKKPRYYMEPGRMPKGGDPYYNGGTQWNSPQTMDHVVRLTPPPGSGGWSAPPPGTNSGDFSSGQSGQNHIPQSSPNMGGIGSKSQFSYEELVAATRGFTEENLLGQGGFGYVHKGVLPDGREVAVKCLKSGSGQGEREFQAEVEIISRVHHRHLVSLVGYCIADGRKMLVYEFVENNTLEFHLHGIGQPVMDWATRLRIALGSAKGLAYLHEDCHPRIIHRDIKAANILLDFNFEAMVADFGLAKLTSDTNTHVSTRVMGTFGYLAPEYASSGKLSDKSDVFSFGVMLLELITGKRPVDPSNMMEDSLVDWARPLLDKAMKGIFDQLVDPRLENNYNPQEMTSMVSCAAASVRHSARRRPKMSQIVRALEGNSSLDDMSEGAKPVQNGVHKPNGNTEVYDTRAYDADMMKFRKMVLLSNQELSSSEYGATSEYGLNPSSSSNDSRETGKLSPNKQKL